MSEQTLEKLIHGYMATRQPVYAFGWQGGEPLLMGLEFFKKVTELQIRYGGDGYSVANAIQTNAMLISDEWANHFARFGFLVGCSMDGPDFLHDRYRRDKSGGPTHARVMNGIRKLQRHGVDFNILILVNRANVGRALTVYDYLVDRGFFHHQYIPCVELNKMGKPQPFAITGRQWGDFLCTIFDRWHLNDRFRVSVQIFDGMIRKIMDGSACTCNLADDCCRYFVAEHNGDLYPCDFFVKKELKIGNVTDMGWHEAVNSPVYRRFGSLKSHIGRQCATCDCLDLCMGDCLKHRQFGVGHRHNLSFLCEGWRRFIRHARGRLTEAAKDILVGG